MCQSWQDFSEFWQYFLDLVFAHWAMERKSHICQNKVSHIFYLYKAGFGASAIVKETGMAQHNVERCNFAKMQ